MEIELRSVLPAAERRQCLPVKQVTLGLLDSYREILSPGALS
jgi:hypothetical protein